MHLFCDAPDSIRLMESTSLSLQPGEIRIAVAASGLSPGTESRCFAGKQPDAPAGGFIPGYQCAGRVSESRSDLFVPGDLVFSTGTQRSERPRLWGGHCSEAIVNAAKAYRLPPHTSLPLAALAKLAAIARHGIRMAAPLPTERIAIVGLGPIGFFSAAILRLLGHDPVAFDLSPERCELFRSLGGSASVIDPSLPVAPQIQTAAQPNLLIDATGAPALLPQLLGAGHDLPWDDSIRPGLRLLLQGSYPGDVQFNYQNAFMREITLLIPRDNQPADLREVLAWIADGRLRLPEGAIALASPSNAQEIYSALKSARGLPLTTVFDWNT
jgi:2-desacetyl-2-hydroxyethyl bacteriochlorophyllide A dehydrogenase